MNNNKITLSGTKNGRGLLVSCLPAPRPPGAGPCELGSFAYCYSVGPYSRGHWRDTARRSREVGGFPSQSFTFLGCLLWRPSGRFHHHPKRIASRGPSLACRLRPSSGLLQHSPELIYTSVGCSLILSKDIWISASGWGGVCSKWVGGCFPSSIHIVVVFTLAIL